ncbi:hypothetical protein SISNIDRAFT_487014 [Sistotremastrum niveocremeum HHB9708]|uniref:DUF6535 domain-containing protein n=1 Tax=Sistotremastrum niveocremeum HHB9708 TaxID=1314777 RepID=A0A164T4V4_9AGAM|nr:hypothetical protein SISNIDRAFT_487014 [Sistotremastrum niveocremeum HHB9708]
MSNKSDLVARPRSLTPSPANHTPLLRSPTISRRRLIVGFHCTLSLSRGHSLFTMEPFPPHFAPGGPPFVPDPRFTSPFIDMAHVYSRMLFLMEDQNRMMASQGMMQAEQSQLLRDHSKMLETLEKDATRNDKAYEGRILKDESTWGALDKEALAKMKVIVDGWKDLMNVSLIFIALFLTVVTAFISPIIQLFSTPSSSSTSKPPLPPTTLQLVALFYYLALMFSICNSAMCVLGLQWAGRLLSVPLGKTNLERALNRERRKVLAEQRLLPLIGVLFWTLLLSIGFFVIGFLIQLWALSFSFKERASILIIGAVTATALAITILGVILATTYHATAHANSPFESPLSTVARASWAWVIQITKKIDKESTSKKDKQKPWHSHPFTVTDLDPLLHPIRRFVPWVLQKPPLASEPSSDQSSGRQKGAQNEIKGTIDKPIEVLMQESADDNETVQALKAYARLVINTNDAEVLERVVPSFEIGEWCKSGGELLPIFSAVWERFLATDTSLRVKETVKKQLIYCTEWSEWRHGFGWKEDLEGNAITRFCRNHCKDRVERSREPHRQFFSLWVFFTSFDPHNKDLRGYPREQSYGESVARVLSSYDRDGQWGHREDVFYSAVRECQSLLHEGRSDDVTRILSHRDRSSVLRSLLRNPHMGWDDIECIIALIIRGKEVTILDGLAEFFSYLPDIEPVFGKLPLMDFLGFILPALPPTFTVPRSFDLTPALILFLRHQAQLDSLSRYSDILFYFLDHGGFERLSSLRPAHVFFQSCLMRSSNDNLSKNNCDRAKLYLEPHRGLIALPPPSHQELQNLVNVLQQSQDNRTSEDLEKNFVDAVKECDSLCREGMQAEIKALLELVNRVSLLGLVFQDQHLCGRHVSSLISSIIEADPPECIRAAPALIADSSITARWDGDLPLLSFLATLIQFLPSDYIVPPEFDLSWILSLFVSTRPNLQTWRRHSDTLMHYLYHGALDTLSDQASVGYFLNICTDRYPWIMENWRQDQQSSALTRERAIELKKRLEEHDAAVGPVIESHAVADLPDLLNPEVMVRPTSMAFPTWDAFRRRLGNIWSRNWIGRTVATASDVEMGLRDQSDT